MKYILCFVLFAVHYSFGQADNSIYDVIVKNVDGDKISLSQFKGQKLLFIVLPVSAQDTTASVKDIARLQEKYQSSLVIIGVPAEEAGFKITEISALKKIYKDAGVSIIIAEVMKVKKGTRQSSLFQWLTSKNLNHHFDLDVQGVGSKLFVDETGELYAVMGPGLSLTSPLMTHILTRSMEKRAKRN